MKSPPDLLYLPMQNYHVVMLPQRYSNEDIIAAMLLICKERFDDLIKIQQPQPAVAKFTGIYWDSLPSPHPMPCISVGQQIFEFTILKPNKIQFSIPGTWWQEYIKEALMHEFAKRYNGKIWENDTRETIEPNP